MQLAQATGSTALAVAATNVIEMAAVQAGPGAVAIGTFPTFSAIGAAQTVTGQIIRNDTGAVIGQSLTANSGAGASTVGPMCVVAPIPAGMAGGISLQVLSSAAVGNAVGSATAPISLLVMP